MKWFKHISDSGDDPDIDDAITLFGYKANYIFWRTLEVMAREFDINNPGKNTFSLSFFKSKLRTNWGPTSEVLEFYQTRRRIYFELFNNNGLPSIRLNCPKLKDMCDEYTQKLLKENRETIPTEIGRDSGIEEEVEEEARKKEQLDYSQLQTKTDPLCKSLNGHFKNFNFYAWRQEQVNKQKHPEAIEECLSLLWENRKGIKKGPRPYLTQLMKIKGPNAFERIAMGEHEKRKEEELKYDGSLRSILKT